MSIVSDELLKEAEKIRLDRLSRYSDLLAFYRDYATNLSKKKRYLGWCPSIDRAIGGLRPGQLMTITAPTNVGKTLMALNTVKHDLEHGTKNNIDELTVLLSLEESEEGLLERIIQMEMKVSSYEIEKKFENEDKEFIAKAEQLEKKYENFVTLVYRITSNEIVRYMLALQRMYKKKIGFVIVDYGGLIKSNFNDEFKRITDTMQTLSELALMLKVPVVNFSQVSRSVAKGLAKNSDDDGLHAAKGSGEVENSSKVLINVTRMNVLPALASQELRDAVESQKKDFVKIKIAKKKQGKRIECVGLVDFKTQTIDEWNKPPVLDSNQQTLSGEDPF